MKKLFAIVLAVALIAAMSVTAFAANVTANGNTEKVVTGTFVNEQLTDTYKVDIAWGAMAFNYKIADKTWSTDSHNWIANENAVAGWVVAAENGNKITLTNHSSQKVTAAFEYTATIQGTTATFSAGDELEIAAPVAGATAGVEAVTLVTIGGTALTSGQEAVEVGSIAITLS